MRFWEEKLVFLKWFFWEKKGWVVLDEFCNLWENIYECLLLDINDQIRNVFIVLGPFD
jgi:hypothetical protein